MLTCAQNTRAVGPISRLNKIKNKLTFPYKSDVMTSDDAKSTASIRTSNKSNESTSSPSPVPSVVSRVLIPIPPAG